MSRSAFHEQVLQFAKTVQGGVSCANQQGQKSPSRYSVICVPDPAYLLSALCCDAAQAIAGLPDRFCGSRRDMSLLMYATALTERVNACQIDQ